MVARFETELDTTIGVIRTAAEDAQDITSRLRERAPEWTAQVDTVLTQASNGATEFSALSTDLRARSEEARKVLETVQAALDRNAGRFDTIIQNAESITTRIDKESMQLIEETLDRVARGAEDFSGLAERAERFLAEESPSLRKTVANLRLTSDQLKLAAVEIRTKPWLLLYTPKTKELESEYILQTARSYAAAVSDLRAASESLEAAAGADGNPLASDRESLVQMTERLGEAFKAYEQAEQKLLDLLIEKNP
jgi:ABC-type transporter Mla subunit MlaD